MSQIFKKVFHEYWIECGYWRWELYSRNITSVYMTIKMVRKYGLKFGNAIGIINGTRKSNNLICFSGSGSDSNRKSWAWSRFRLDSDLEYWIRIRFKPTKYNMKVVWTWNKYEFEFDFFPFWFQIGYVSYIPYEIWIIQLLIGFSFTFRYYVVLIRI